MIPISSVYLQNNILTIICHSFGLYKGSTSPEYGSGSRKKKPTITIAVSASLASFLVCLVIALYVAWRKKKRSRQRRQGTPTKFFFY